jgi:hypothetical protein
LFAVCGLECNKCKIYNAPKNPEIAKELVKIFDGRWENVGVEDFHCNGCRDVENCWTEDCWIRDCCVKEKMLNYCYECQDFPCNKLKNWADENEGYAIALQNLKEMKKKSKKVT